MKHVIGSVELPKPVESGVFSDSLCINVGNIIKAYCNETLGDAWKEVNNGDGYVVNNVLSYPWTNTENTIRQQFPILSVYRSESERRPFTQLKDYLESTVTVEYIIEIPDAINSNKWGILHHVFTAINSTVQRNIVIDGYDLLTYLNVENIKVGKHKASVVKGQSFSIAYGFYFGSTQLKVLEIIDIADEDNEPLELVGISIDLGDETENLEDFIQMDNEYE